MGDSKILDLLFEMKDEKNALFQAKLTPGIAPDKFIGTRMPDLRKLAKQIKKDPMTEKFLKQLPHEYYDENMLQSVLLSEMKEFDKAAEYVEAFLPYVDNWATCDTLRPKVFGKHKTWLLEKSKEWMNSSETYTCRFGVDMLMTFFLDDEFKPEYLEYPAKIISDEYYVNMMISWYYATALSKQWEATIPYIEQYRLSEWIHKKTIQKARESFRITNEQKEYLKAYLKNGQK